MDGSVASGRSPRSDGAHLGRAPSVQRLNGKQGTELAEVIVQKIKSAVNTTVHKSGDTVA